MAFHLQLPSTVEYRPSSRVPCAAVVEEPQSEWANPNEDLVLLQTCGESSLDVAQTDQGTQLVILPIMQRVSRFFSSSTPQSELDRQARLTEYAHLAYRETPRFPMRKDTIEFYKCLRKWKSFNLGSLSRDVQCTLSVQMKQAFRANEQAERILRHCCPNGDGRVIPGLESNWAEGRNKQVRAQWDLRVGETRLAQELGVEPKKIGVGANGAQFGFGLDGRKLVIIKPNAGKPFFNESMIGERPQLDVCKHDPRVAGAVAYMADAFFGFDLIPPTYRDGDGSSIQLFVDQTDSADKVKIHGRLLRDVPKEDFTPEQIESLQLKAVLNYFLGDIDAKDDKLRLQLGGDGEIIRFFETDNDNILPHEELCLEDDACTLAKTHQWKEHNWAGIPFNPNSSKMAKVLAKLFEGRVLDQFVRKVAQEHPNFWTPERLTHMRERVAVIKTCVKLGYAPFHMGVIYGREVLEHEDFYLERQMVEEYMMDEAPHPRAEAFADRFAEHEEGEEIKSEFP